MTPAGFARDIDGPIYRSLATASTPSAWPDWPVSASVDRTSGGQSSPWSGVSPP